MKVLTKMDVKEWLAGFPSNSEYVHSDERGVFFSDPEASCIDIEYPPKLERLPFLARYLATLGYESQDFNGALLWLTEWDVWNRLDEGIGYRIIEAMHRAAGQSNSFESAPGHLFRADELTDAAGMLLQPMIFGWDAIHLPNWSYGTGPFFLHVSHDSFVSVVTRTKEFYDRAFGLLKQLDFNPKAGHELRTGRFCRAISTGHP